MPYPSVLGEVGARATEAPVLLRDAGSLWHGRPLADFKRRRRRVERLSHRLAREGGSRRQQHGQGGERNGFRTVIIADPYLEHHAIRPPGGSLPCTACHMNRLSTMVTIRSPSRSPHF